MSTATAPGTPYALTANLLAHVVAFYEGRPDATELPERRYVGPGAPGLQAWDCEQLVVALANYNPGAAPGVGGQYGTVPDGVNVMGRHVTLSVQLVRCCPVPDDDGNPPPADAIQAAGAVHAQDAELLYAALVSFLNSPDMVGPAGGVARVGGVASLGPDGGLSGLEATLVVTSMGGIG